MVHKVANFLNKGLWMIRSQEMPFFKRVSLNAARILMLTGRFFIQNQCTVKASALTYYTLLSIVPILALIFGFAKGYGYAEMLQEKLRGWMSAYPDMAEKIIEFSDRTLQNAKGGVVAGVGVILLIWTAVKLLSNIELSLNGIWGVKRGRTMIRKISDYIAILIICPFLMLTAGSAIVFAASHLNGFTQKLPFSSTINALINYAVPVVAVWAVFTFIYMAIPNTKVRFRAAMPAGFISALAYLIVQSAYVFAQFVVVKYNAIYGSFAALPLFLIWLNLSWMIVLAGSELSFAIQNVNEYEMVPEDHLLSLTQKNIYAMELISQIARVFRAAQLPLSDEQLSETLEIPIRTTRKVLYEMVAAGLLCEVYMKDENTLRAYQPAMPLEELTPLKVIRSLEDLGGVQLENELDKKYYGLIGCLRSALDVLPENKPFGQDGESA